MLGIGAPAERGSDEIPAGVKPPPASGIIPTWTLDPNTLLGNPANAITLADEIPLGSGLQFVGGPIGSARPGPTGQPGPQGQAGPSGPPAGSAGEIQFNNGSGGLGADANLHWDDANKRLRIGTPAPHAVLSVSRDGGANEPLVALQNTGSDTGASVLDVFTSGRGDGFTDGYIAQFRNVASTKMYIRGDGLIGIGPNNTGPTAQLDIRPPPGATPGVHVSQTGPTNFNIGTNDFYYNNFTIFNDQISTSNPPGGGGPGRLSANNIFTYGFGIDMQSGGNDTGSKAAFTATLEKHTNSNPGAQPGANVIPGYHGATGDHVGAAFGIGASASDGGTDTSLNGCNGTLAACNPFLRVNAGATNYFWIGGAEVDIGSAAGSSYRNRFGWNVCAMGDGPQGVDFDCAYAIGGAGTSPWKLGLGFSMFNGGQPIAANGTLIGTYGSFSAAFGIDFRQVNLSQFAIISNGFSVTGTGVLMSSGFNNVSDRRLKRDIEDGSKYGLDDLLKIKVRDAVLISEGAKKPTIIAQELYSLIPEAVCTNGDDGTCELASDMPGWGVSYTTLVPLLIKAVQELTRKVELLERRTRSREILDMHDDLRGAEEVGA